MIKQTLLFLVCLVISIPAQDESAFSDSDQKNAGIFDPSKFSIQHSLSFGMASMSGVSNLKSQSLYSTMLQYKFTAPVTINLNFSLPIHSTFSSSQNFTPYNLSSFDYFKNVPFNFSLNWQPRPNLNFMINVSRFTESSYFWSDPFYGFNSFNRNPFF